MQNIIRTVVILAISLLPSTAIGQTSEKIDILKILDRFIVSNAAAAKCFQPDTETFVAFQENYRHVLILSSMRLKEMYPNATEEKIQLVMKGHTDKLNENVDAKIQQVGCGDKSVKLLIDLFIAHAAWKIDSQSAQ